MAAFLFKPDNRMAQILGGENAMSSDALVARSEQRLIDLRGAMRDHIRKASAQIVIVADGPIEEVVAECHALGDLALSICEVAVVADWPDMGEAARGLYEMVEALMQRGAWHDGALKVHVDALRMLAAEPAPPAEAVGMVLAKLRAMRERVGVQCH
jgi:hypothetical protein